MYNRTVLDNGIRVISEEITHVRSVSIGVWVQCGSRNEDLKTSGTAHFIEHMLFKGTENRTAFDIASAIDSVGGFMNAATGKELTSFYVKIPDYHLALALDLLADILKNPQFDTAEIAKETAVVLQEISMVEDSPDDYIHEFFDAVFWDNHPLGRPVLGKRETVEKFNRDSLLSFFKTRYRGNNLILTAAGNLKHDLLVDLVQRNFGSLAKEAVKEEITPPIVSSKEAILEKELEQVHIIIGTLAPSATSPKRYPCFLMNAILGGTMSSRLFQEIREKRGLAYAIHSYVINYADTGMLGIYAGTGEDKVSDVVGLVIEVLQGLCADLLTEKEMTSARELVKGNFLLGMESTDNRMMKLARDEICLKRYVPPEEVIAQIDAVGAEDIRTLSRELFNPDIISLAAIGRISEKDCNLNSYL
ncbi:MAG: pitrilysin family protein [Syntrophales bacterium]|nr:pitrilysin family protein [Syntrophales bacterium]